MFARRAPIRIPPLPLPAPSPLTQSNWSRLKHEEALVSALKDVPFVTASDGSLW